jgi:pimeloyl-ACP methyl ester carboxylesterase
MEKISSKDGTLIAFEKSGSGPALVLVHGTSADHTRWVSVLPQLQEKYTAYAVDRRGRGESGDNFPYSIEREFEDIAAVIDSIGEPVFLLGHSFGAICSLEAARLTQNISKLILYEPPLAFYDEEINPPGVVETLQLQLEAGDHAGLVESFLREIPRVPVEDIERMKASPTWQGRVAAAHTLLREVQISESGYRFDVDNFSDLTTPTLLLKGSDSPKFFHTAIQVLHETLPNNRVAVMPGQQHVAMNTAPELFINQVMGFLSEG